MLVPRRAMALSLLTSASLLSAAVEPPSCGACCSLHNAREVLACTASTIPPPPPGGAFASLVMLYTDEIEEYAAETIAINADYARRHGYDLHLVRSELVKKSGAGKDAHAVTLLPHAKMKHIHDAMKVGSPDAPAWVVWLDTDLAILNHKQRLEDLVAQHGGPTVNLIASSEERGAHVPTYNANGTPHINAGAVMFRSGKWTSSFLQAWHSIGYEFDPSDPWRQYTLTAWGHRFQKFANRPPPDQQMLNEVWVQRKDLDLHSTAVVLPTTVLNSRWPAWALDAPGGPKGMQFALHAYATSSEERVTLFRKLRRSLCDLGVDGFTASAVSPTAIAAPLLEGMWEHVKQDDVGAYKNALLCQSLYVLCGGNVDCKLFQKNEYSRFCLIPETARRIAGFMAQRQQLDVAVFA